MADAYELSESRMARSAAGPPRGTRLVARVAAAILIVTCAPLPVERSADAAADPLAPITSTNRGSACADDLSQAGLTRLFSSEFLGIAGMDYPRPFRLADGRVLWLAQDARMRTPAGQTLVHNIGLIQSGRCFSLLRSGTAAAPTSWLLAAATTPFQRWYWPLAGEMGSDGNFKMHMVRMDERSGRYLGNAVPQGVVVVSIRLADLVASAPTTSLSSSPDLFGWSITSDATYSYLYSHCYRQFGFSTLGHDFACSQKVKVARVLRGRFDTAPTYWDGARWQADRSRAVNVMPTEPNRAINPSQVIWTGTEFLAITKEGDWFGLYTYIDSAPAAHGPFRSVAVITTTPKCAVSVCNTYFSSWIPWRGDGGNVLATLSHNRWDGAISTVYRPTVFTAPTRFRRSTVPKPLAANRTPIKPGG